VALDTVTYWPLYSALRIRPLQLASAASGQQVQSLLTQLDEDYAMIKARNQHDVMVSQLYTWSYATAAWRSYLAGQDPQKLLERARSSLAQLREQGNNMPETEENALLIDYVDAAALLRAHHDPGPALLQVEEAHKRCAALAPQDVQCLLLAARAGLVEAQWLAQQQQPAVPALQRALARASEAAQAPEQTADAWQVVAEAQLRLHQAGQAPADARRQIAEGLAAAQKCLALNPNHALGLATQGALLLARAQSERDVATRQAAARDAVAAFQRAFKSDSLVESQYAAAAETARAVAQ
jgi:hypothetical protein